MPLLRTSILLPPDQRRSIQCKHFLKEDKRVNRTYKKTGSNWNEWHRKMQVRLPANIFTGKKGSLLSCSRFVLINAQTSAHGRKRIPPPPTTFCFPSDCFRIPRTIRVSRFSGENRQPCAHPHRPITRAACDRTFRTIPCRRTTIITFRPVQNPPASRWRRTTRWFSPSTVVG